MEAMMSTRPSPPLSYLTASIHDELDDGLDAVIGVRLHDEDVSFGIWSPPGPHGDVHEALTGWVAPVDFHSIGISYLDADRRCTTLLDRCGEVITVDGDDADPVPTGPLTEDHLKRAFGLATAPSPVSIATWIDLEWLDVLARFVFAAEHSLSAEDLLRTHPLHQPGVQEPERLRAEVHAIDRHFTWSDVRHKWLGLAARADHPPGGMEIPEQLWFDDG